MRPDDVGLGGFDSHALPPRGGRVFACALLLFVMLAASGHAQATPAARAGVAVPKDSIRAPITPRNAFLYSLAIPGLGQAKLDRPLVGAGFFLMEAFAIALVHRTADDLRLARSFQRDSVPLRYAFDAQTGIPQLDSKGKPVVAAWAPSYYSPDLVRARRLQLEDWSAVLVFNHLIAGAEAFVAAQLWDLPQRMKLRIAPRAGGGFTVGATISPR